MKDIFLKYQSLVQDTEDLSAHPAIEFDTMKLLEIIATKHYKNTPLTVSEAMQLTIVASPASIHRKLNYLREFGYIDSFFKNKNRRTQYLKPLTKSEILFNNRGELLLKILAENNNQTNTKANIKEFYC
jgi:hypothetical protein